MALTDRLMDNLRVKLPGAIDPLIKTELWNTLNDACREGHLWRETIDVPLVEGEVAYEVAPAGAEVVHVYGVSHATLDVTGTVYDNGMVVLRNRTPLFSDTTTPLFVDAALTPSLDAGADIENLIPADMWSTHHNMLVDGVIGRMMGQVAKPYSNPALAAYHLRSYRSQMVEARRRIKTGGIPGAQTWRYPRWAR